MADKPIGLADHFDHACLDEAPGIFEPNLVELGGDLDRLTKQIHAASERQSEVEAVPGREQAPAARCIGQRHDGHPGEPSDIDDPVLTVIAGPRGPSGVIPTQPPSLSRFSISRSADEPPRLVEPAIVSIPK